MKICSVEGCDRKQKARTWCTVHWGRWRRHGDPTAGGPERDAITSGQFSARTVPAEGGCILWRGATKSKGYGAYYISGRRVLAHRYAWEQANGPIPEGLVIDHMCGVTLCVNPDHLRLATYKQNAEHRTKMHGQNKSGFRNVFRAPGGWRVVVKSHGVTHWGGTYETPEEANEEAVELRNQLFTHNLLDRVGFAE